MVFSEPKVEFVKIDLTGTIVTGASLCDGTETRPGGGVGCSNRYYATLTDAEWEAMCSSTAKACTIFCS